MAAAANSSKPDIGPVDLLIAIAERLVAAPSIEPMESARDLRDEIALVALKALLAHARALLPPDHDQVTAVARDAYLIADAMLAARHRPTSPENAQ